MFKKSLLFLLLMAIFAPWAAQAQTTVEIGEGTAASNANPIGTYYNYSINEQLYTAEEIGMAGTISSISFYYTGTAAKDFPIEVYMQNVSAEDLSEEGISLADADLVFEGTYSITGAGWFTIDLTTPFVYDGTSNLLIGINKGYVYWYSGGTWQCTPTDVVMARYTQNDNSAYTTSTVPSSANSNRPDIQIDITPAGGVVCEKPSGIVPGTLTAHEFSFSIEGGSGLYNIELKEGEGEFELVEENYSDDAVTLTGLTQSTDYQVRVQSVCEDRALSGWKTYSFTTLEACPTPTELTVVEVTPNSATLRWTENGEATSWQIDLNGEIITAPTNPYTINTLVAEEVYTAKVRAYCNETDQSNWSNSVKLYPTNKLIVGEPSTTNSYLPTYIFYLNSLTQQIYTPEELGEAASFLSIDFYCTQDNTYERQFDIYMVSTQKDSFVDGTDWINVTASDLVYSGTVLLTEGWNSFVFDTPFIYDGLNNVALIVDASADSYQSGPSFYVYETAENQAIRIYSDGTDYDPLNPTAYSGTLQSVKNHVRILTGELPSCVKPTGLTAEVTNHTATLSWTSDATAWQIEFNEEIIDVTENPYTLTGLDAETPYRVKVRTNCGDGDVSDWAEVIFTTDIACPAPTNLIADPLVYAANISWNSANDNFELWWREKPEGAAGFEDGTLGDWTTIDADGDGSEWFAWTSSEMVVGHNGSDYVATSASYAGTALNPDNYLVSPEITLGGSITFWACAQDAAWPSEHFGVAVSTTGNTDAADFTTIVEYDMTAKALGNWYEYTVDLSEYSGQGYVAIRHFDCTDWFRLNVDDITILQPGDTEPEWTVVNPATNPYNLTGLTPETTYEVKVRSVCGGIDGESEWVMTEFTTHAACTTPDNLTVEAQSNYAVLSWANYQNSYNLRYRPTTHGEVILSTNFDDSDFGGWTTIEADGDEYNWVLASTAAGIYHNDGIDVTGNGHNDSHDFVISGSYSNYAGVALTPDNYLVSPQVELGGRIIFWAQAQDVNYSAEHFGVAVSTETNTDPEDFTMLQEWTLTAKSAGVTVNPSTTRSGESLRAGNWYQYTVDLSAYSGQGFVAIRHFGCSDQFLMNVDDIVIEGPAQEYEWIELTANTNVVTITGLTPLTEYEWQVQGITDSCEGGVTEWTELETFTTTEFNTETIALGTGTNWLSVNVEITLDQLKAALVEALPGTQITIYSQGNGNTTYNGSTWRGTLRTLDVTQMYMVSVTDVCEISLTGTPVIPSEHPITIHTGTNWIAFPLNVNMTLTDAFAGFAINGDMVISQSDGYSTYNGVKWRGSLSTLEPIKGYMYKSAATGDRTFTFPEQ